MKRPRLGGSRGFTLIEIMIVLAILGMLFSFVGVNVVQHWRDAKVQIARSQIGMFAEALEHFSLDNDVTPTTEQGLDALLRQPSVGKRLAGWHGPYLQKAKLPLDPWARSYRYESEGARNYRLCSDGPDGEAGTPDDVCAD